MTHKPYTPPGQNIPNPVNTTPSTSGTVPPSATDLREIAREAAREAIFHQQEEQRNLESTLQPPVTPRGVDHSIDEPAPSKWIGFGEGVNKVLKGAAALTAAGFLSYGAYNLMTGVGSGCTNNPVVDRQYSQAQPQEERKPWFTVGSIVLPHNRQSTSTQDYAHRTIVHQPMAQSLGLSVDEYLKEYDGLMKEWGEYTQNLKNKKDNLALSQAYGTAKQVEFIGGAVHAGSDIHEDDRRDRHPDGKDLERVVEGVGHTVFTIPETKEITLEQLYESIDTYKESRQEMLGFADKVTEGLNRYRQTRFAAMQQADGENVPQMSNLAMDYLPVAELHMWKGLIDGLSDNRRGRGNDAFDSYDKVLKGTKTSR